MWQLKASRFRCCRIYESLRVFLLLYGLFIGVHAEPKSVPLPIYMENQLNAGREVYDKQSTPTQLDGTPTIVNLSM
jgi:hypothetical protein